MLAVKLKEKRKEKGMTQQEVATRSGIAQQTYNSYENGYRVPSIESIKNIAKTLNCSIDDLLADD